jgi:hypothetical protein
MGLARLIVLALVWLVGLFRAWNCFVRYVEKGSNRVRPCFLLFRLCFLLFLFLFFYSFSTSLFILNSIFLLPFFSIFVIFVPRFS